MKLARILLIVPFCALALMAGGCDLSRNQMKMDRSSDMEFQDFRDGLAPRTEPAPDEMSAVDNSKIPELQSYVAQPSDNLKPMPLVSISVNQTIPLRDVLFELAEQAQYDIELDPNINGSIIFTARNRPFDEVVERIAGIAGLRYKFEGDVLRVEIDVPYHKTYKIDYLSYIRRNKGSINNDVSVVSGEGANAGSKFGTETESEADFWGELDKNIAQILGVSATGALVTASTPQITAADQNPAPVTPVTPVAVDGSGNPTTVQVQAPQATLNVASLPTDAAAGGAAPVAPATTEATKYALNKQAGIISIYATDVQHKQIRDYLTELRRSVTAQVLIEAKVLEVSLSDEFSAGIDWSAVVGESFGIGFNTGGHALNAATSLANQQGISANPSLDPEADSELIGLLAHGDIKAAVNAVSRFGTIKALASPRLTVLNNQSAVLNVASNQVYFELDINVTTEDGVKQTDVDSNIRSVPEGVLINVQPSIDLDNRTVSMAVRPTITQIESFVDDPAVQYVTAENNITGVSSRVPVVNIQEMDSVINMRSGQAIIMGGLMQDRTDATDTGIPVLAEVPLVGSLFKTHVDKVSKKELVIFLKATILDGDNNAIHDTDRDLYKTFSDDRRPLKL